MLNIDNDHLIILVCISLLNFNHYTLNLINNYEILYYFLKQKVQVNNREFYIEINSFGKDHLTERLVWMYNTILYTNEKCERKRASNREKDRINVQLLFIA